MTVNPLVGGSNPSRGANFKFFATLVATNRSLPQIRTADGKQDGSTTTRSGGDRPQGDPKGERAARIIHPVDPVKSIV